MTIDTRTMTKEERDALPPDPKADSAVVKELLETKIQELAKLKPVEYDMQRETVAKAYGIRVSTLDAEVDKLQPSRTHDDGGGTIVLKEPEAWIHPVDGVELLDAIVAVFEKYVILPAGAAVMLTLWIIHTFALDAADASPIAAITSPEKRCGKTVVLELLQAIAYRALPASNITSAALFRTIESMSPTLLIDEADSFLRDNEELRGVLNSGHRRATAVIIRTVGDKHEPKTFSTWCPKAIALIGKLPGTLEDRSILVAMRRKSRDENVARIRHRVLPSETANLQRKAARWTKDNIPALKDSDPIVPESLNDRAADCWRPLLAIADKVGGAWPEIARQAALSLMSRDGDSSVTVQLLSDIKVIFNEQGTDKLSSETIVEELVKQESRPWPDWKNGKPISKSQLARQLSKFGIVSKTVRTAGTTIKGYALEQFDDAFARYLDFQNVTPSQPLPVVDCNAFKNVTPETDVTFSKPSQPASAVDCDAVAFSTPKAAEEETI